MFHVERMKKIKYILLFIVGITLSGCAVQKQKVQIQEYTILRGGKPILGIKEGLTAYVFENNKRKIPFGQFIGNKYGIGNFTDIEYWVTIDNKKFKVYVYENAEVEKYFDTSAFIISDVVPEASIIGSRANFIALSVISAGNEDCLSSESLYYPMVIEYLDNLRKEYNHS